MKFSTIALVSISAVVSAVVSSFIGNLNFPLVNEDWGRILQGFVLGIILTFVLVFLVELVSNKKIEE
jgi:pilus assembly protein TadC